MTPDYSLMLPTALRGSLPNGAEEPDPAFADLVAEAGLPVPPDDLALSLVPPVLAVPVLAVPLKALVLTAETDPPAVQAVADSDAETAKPEPMDLPPVPPSQMAPPQMPPLPESTMPAEAGAGHLITLQADDRLPIPQSASRMGVATPKVVPEALPQGHDVPLPIAASKASVARPIDGSGTAKAAPIPQAGLETLQLADTAETSGPQTEGAWDRRPDPGQPKSDRPDSSPVQQPADPAPAKGVLTNPHPGFAPPSPDNPNRSDAALAKFVGAAASLTEAPPSAAAVAQLARAVDPQPAAAPLTTAPRPDPSAAPLPQPIAEFALPGAERAASPQPAATEAALRLRMGEAAGLPRPAMTPTAPTEVQQPASDTRTDRSHFVPPRHRQPPAEIWLPSPVEPDPPPAKAVASRHDALAATRQPATQDHAKPALAVDGAPALPSVPPTESTAAPFTSATDHRPIHPLGHPHTTGTQPPANPPPAQQIAGALVQLATPRPDRIELVLAPEELGRLRFDMTQHGEALHVILSAERPETLDLLRRSLPDLLAELRQAGVQAGSFSFGSWSESGPKGRHFGHDRQDDKDAASPSPPPAPPPSARPVSGLDLRL